MDELISRQDALKAIEDCAGNALFFLHSRTFSEGLRQASLCVQNAPTVPAEPVRHGRWTMNSDRPDTIICNVCDKGFDVWKHEAKDFHYCPGYGARTDLDPVAEKEDSR